MFVDEQSKIISKLTDKKDITPCCGISYESFPPKHELNKKNFVENYMINLNKTETLLIVCYIDKISESLCINKPETKNNRTVIPGDFDRFPELKDYKSENEVYFFNKNFVVYRNNKNI